MDRQFAAKAYPNYLTVCSTSWLLSSFSLALADSRFFSRKEGVSKLGSHSPPSGALVPSSYYTTTMLREGGGLGGPYETKCLKGSVVAFRLLLKTDLE